MYLTPIDKLDRVLKIFVTDPRSRPRITSNQIGGIMRTDFPDLNDQYSPVLNDLYSDFDGVVEKLYEDGYVRRTNMGGIEPHGEEPVYFEIKYNGRVFYQQGGYKQKEINDRVKIKTQKLINFALIFGGVAAGCYYTYELLVKDILHL